MEYLIVLWADPYVRFLALACWTVLCARVGLHITAWRRRRGDYV